MPKEEFQHLFRSLLGGIAWVTQARLGIAVYVGPSQRRLQCPTVQDLLNANRVLQYLTCKPLAMKFRKLNRLWRPVAISDSGFKAREKIKIILQFEVV